MAQPLSPCPHFPHYLPYFPCVLFSHLMLCSHGAIDNEFSCRYILLMCKDYRKSTLGSKTLVNWGVFSNLSPQTGLISEWALQMHWSCGAMLLGILPSFSNQERWVLVGSDCRSGREKPCKPQCLLQTHNCLDKGLGECLSYKHNSWTSCLDLSLLSLLWSQIFEAPFYL